jgi:hypothetical protein
VHYSVNVSCMILRGRWQVSAGLVWSGLRVGEGRETHLAARRRHSCAMPRRSAALAGRRRAGSSAACRPRVLRRPMQAPTPLGSRRRSEAGLGQAAGVSGWGVSLLGSPPRLSSVLPRSDCPARQRPPASLARCRRCRRRVPPRAVAERSVAGAGGSRRRPRRERAHRAERAAAPRGRTQLVRRSFCRRLSSPPPVPEVAVVVACPSSVAAGRGSVLGRCRRGRR